jgi:diguanylate cyclase (GGDEF)-like protein
MAFSAMVAGPWQLGTASAACRGLLVALFNGLAAWELRREPGQDPPSRPVLFWMLAVFAAVGGLRACLAGILPSPLGGQPTQNWSIAAFNLFAIAEALIVSGFMIALSRERVALANYQVALRDPLTGLANRRALDERAIVLDQDRRAGMTTVLLCDLDRFKSINDRFGHGVGDAVIRLVADTAARSLRAEGDMFRLGGEEFVCLLPGLDGDQALLRAERFRRAFAEAAATVSGHRVGATLSIGIASDRSGASTIETLLARADDALYEAKRGGRDQSVRAA